MNRIWELDFYSRPLLDENGKKVWEVVLCESPQNVSHGWGTLFQYHEFCPGNQVNSAWLKDALRRAISQAPAAPDRIRFFRRQMNNMIVRACEDLGLEAKASRRTYALNQLLKQRLETVYPTIEGFQSGQVNPAASVVSYQASPPLPLPDALRGERWAFVNLEVAAFAEMSEWPIAFSEAFPLAMLGLPPETVIPGVIIYSSRAVPLAAWMSGIEMAFLTYAPGEPARLVLETGADDRWTLAVLVGDALHQEAETFETAKQAAQSVHFLAVQADPTVEAFAGFWLLQTINLA